MTTRLVTVALIVISLLSSLLLLPGVPIGVISPNIFPAVIVVVLLFGDTKRAYGAALVGGFLFDLLSALPFGTYLVSYVSSLAITCWIFRTRVTNRSLVAYGSLVVAGIVLIHIHTLVLSQLGKLANERSIALILSREWFAELGYAVLRSIVLAVVVYLVIRLSGRRYTTLARHEF